MARHKEKLDGGVVDAKDAALLDPGQLAAARNCYLLPKNPALTRARGRALSGTVSATAVDIKGLRDCQFDNGDHLLVAMASASYLTAAVADSMTFGVLASGLAAVGSQLEAVQYRNRYFLFNGTSASATGLTIGSNRVIYLSATAAGTPATLRQHGMLAVHAGPSAVTAAGVFSQSAVGYYEYWTTELAKITQDGVDVLLESTFDGTPTTVFITSTATQTVQVPQPAIQNAIATHWRIYRSPVKVAAGDKKFPTGFMVAELSTATITAADTASAVDTGFILPANENGVGDGATVFAAWNNAITLSADNNAYASATPLTFGAITNTVQQGVYGFNFGGFSGNVAGIEVQIKGYSNGIPYPVDVTIGRKRKSNGGWSNTGATWGQQLSDIVNNTATRSVTITASASASPQTVSVGGSTDRWVPFSGQSPFNSSDFGTDFMVVLTVSKGALIAIDYVKVKVYYASTSDSTVQFPTVVYTFSDIVSQVGKRGTPPSSTTGDLYEGSLVVNDVDAPRLVRYSFPDEPESFPSTYFVPFDTNENDRVRLIKVVNGRLVIGLDSSLWRMNFLPNERDAQFDRGKARESISRTYGVVNAMCACVYSPDGPADRLMFVSNQGIHDTDGYDFRTLTDGVDWRNTVAALASTYAPIALINDRERQIVFFYFRNDSSAYGNETYLALPLCYAPDQLTDGKPRIGGLVHMRNFDSGSGGFSGLKSAWAVPRSNGDVSMYLGYGDSSTAAGAGTVYRETGTTIPSQDPAMRFTTRRMYLADLSNEWELGEVYGYAGSYSGGPVVTYSANGTKTNDAGVVQFGSKAVTLAGQKLHKVGFRALSEGLQISAVVSASAYAQEHIVLDGTGFGLEDSGR